MAEYNPYDPYAEDTRTRLRRPGTSSYIPQPITTAPTADTGIPQPSDPYAPPTGGINPDGTYSGTGTGESPVYPSTPGYQQPWIAAGYPDYMSWARAGNANGGINPGGMYTGGETPSYASETPPTSGVQSPDPVTAAVVAAFLKKGIMPRKEDIPYWTRRIAETGDWNDPQHQQYWLDRMAMQYGGVGDYSESGKVGYDNNYRMEPGYGASAQAAPTAAPGAMSVAQSYGSGGGGYGDSGFGAAIKAMVLKLMGQSPGDISTNPTYQGAIRAYDTEQQRAAETERNAIAERMAAEGTNNSGGYSDRLLGAEQARGENTASFAGNLAVRELERQRDEIMQALTIGAGMMTEEQRLALSEKLGLINASLQQQSITNQNNQFNQTLGWNQDMFQYNANQGWY